MQEALEGVMALRQLLADEQRRLARAAGLDWPLRAKHLEQAPDESPDALRFRLTLVRSLLLSREEDLALQESNAAVKFHPNSAAALVWNGRCLLRRAERDEGIRMLTAAVAAGPSAGQDTAWANASAVLRLDALQKASRLHRRAEDAFAYGDFVTAASRYGDALEVSPIDDRWGRASLLASRAACYRRGREFTKAVQDCDSALALFPRYARAQFRKAACLLEAGRAKEAVAAFEVMLRLDRSWPNLCDWLVRAHAQAKRTGQEGPKGKTRQRAPARAPEAESIPTLEGDLYAVLGVSCDATDKQLKRAYRLMSLKYHPDKQGGSTRCFQQIATAYETLSDPVKRTSYDEGADMNKKKGNPDESDESEREERSLREEVERKYYPERYKFWPFGDPFIDKRKLQASRRSKAGKPQWMESDESD